MDVQSGNNCEYVVAELVGRVAGRRNARGSEAAPRDAVDVVSGCEPCCKLVVNVGVGSEASQQDQRPAGAAPVNHFQLYTSFHFYKFHVIRSGRGQPGGFLRRAPQFERLRFPLRLPDSGDGVRVGTDCPLVSR